MNVNPAIIAMRHRSFKIHNSMMHLHHRQMSTHLTFPGFHGIWEFDMPAAGEDTKSLTNVWKKTNEQQLF
ncbi:MAG: hypothetical protein Q7V05_09630, partial [Methanoregula sp.]|nr:hypothetical protein [Methanoregula sp.]